MDCPIRANTVHQGPTRRHPQDDLVLIAAQYGRIKPLAHLFQRATAETCREDRGHALDVSAIEASTPGRLPLAGVMSDCEPMSPIANNPTVTASAWPLPKPKRARSKFLVRYLLPSDTHAFVGRIYDLSILAHHFDSYEALAVYPYCKYAIDVNEALTRLVTRVESLNLAGNMLWPERLPHDFRTFPLSRHEWLTVIADVFLMRYISVVDCALLVVNEVIELRLDRHACTLGNLRRKGLRPPIERILGEMVRDQGNLRSERNARVHHGEERPFTQDDTTFKTAAIFEHRMNGVTGTDCFGRRINLERMLKEGLVELQQEFNRSTRPLVRQLDRLYDELSREFEARFEPRTRTATHELNVRGSR
jgi:hypothetical protein